MAELVDETVSQEGAPPAVAPATPGAAGRPIPPWAAFLVGVAAVLVGLAPWLARGARLPLQNLWATEFLAEMPMALLPFSQYLVTWAFALIVVAGALAGIAARVLVARAGNRGPAWWIGGGLLAGHAVAVVQTMVVVAPNLRSGPDSAVYLAGIGGGIVVCLLISAGAFALIALAPRAGALVGLSTGAIAAQLWLPTALIDPFDRPSIPMWLFEALGYVMPVLVGAAIAWAGVRTAGRIVAALLSLLLVWLAPPLTTAVSAALGTRILARDLEGMLEYGTGIFRDVATDAALVRGPLLVTVVVAAVGLVVHEVLSRRVPSTGQPS